MSDDPIESHPLDALPAALMARRLFDGQTDALRAVGQVLGPLADGGELMARTVRAGGRLVYAGAGSSGLMAAADAMELAGTFGLSPSQLKVLMAGGLPVKVTLPGGPEDDAGTGQGDGAQIEKRDCLIAVAASGRTPYTVAVAQAARASGATVIALSNAAGTPLLAHATLPICLDTPAECLDGSTRMGAGTAQKVALNIMSTVMGIALGHVHDGLMVNLRSDNRKLRARAISVVAQIAGVPLPMADAHLHTAAGDIKVAILLARGVGSTEADAILARHGGHLREALAHLPPTRP